MINMAEAKMYFTSIPLFADLTIGDHDLLNKVAVQTAYPRKTMLAHKNSSFDRLFIMIRGRAKVFAHDERDHEIIHDILKEGDFFGELSLISEEPVMASIMSVEDSLIISISKVEFQQLLISTPQLAANLLTTLTRRLREANLQNELLQTSNVQMHVVRALHQLARSNGSEFVISYRTTHRDIATIVGVSRNMVTHILCRLEASGLIRFNDHGIILVPSICV